MNVMRSHLENTCLNGKKNFSHSNSPRHFLMLFLLLLKCEGTRMERDGSKFGLRSASSNSLVVASEVESLLPQLKEDHRIQLSNEYKNEFKSDRLQNQGNQDLQNYDNGSNLSLIWEDVSVHVKTRKLQVFPSVFLPLTVESSRRVILRPQSGRLESTNLIAVVGPSGAGKTSLLKCLAGVKRTGFSGNIFIKSWSNNRKSSVTTLPDPWPWNGSSCLERRLKSVKVIFISQNDHMIDVLSVKESLMFASKLKNHNENDEEFHEKVLQNLLLDLGLASCMNTRVEDLSGGQLKRLSFALELVSRPEFMILDEPTSGLDSSSAANCVQVLRNLTSKSIGIIASIHQPSAKVLFTFTHVYILSANGDCIYNGPTSNLLTHFSTLGLNCPTFHNPADFVIEVASGDFGPNIIEVLAKSVENAGRVRRESDLCESSSSIKAVIDRMMNQRYPSVAHLKLLVSRNWTSSTRRPLLSWLRLVQHITLSMMGSFMYNYNVGEANGCFSDLVNALPLNVTSLSRFSSETEGSFLKQQRIATDNATFMFFAILFLSFANMMPVVLTYPLVSSLIVSIQVNENVSLRLSANGNIFERKKKRLVWNKYALFCRTFG